MGVGRSYIALIIDPADICTGGFRKQVVCLLVCWVAAARAEKKIIIRHIIFGDYDCVLARLTFLISCRSGNNPITYTRLLSQVNIKLLGSKFPSSSNQIQTTISSQNTETTAGSLIPYPSIWIHCPYSAT